MRKKLPIGIESFEDFSKENFYYIDKTMFIADLLHNMSKVNLFTRPRRFGKSLNLSMLKAWRPCGFAFWRTAVDYLAKSAACISN